MMMQATRYEVNFWEWTFLRGGLTLYAGWLTAATILNVTATFKSFGFSEFSWYSEEQITITVLYVAFIIYTLASYLELNPLFGGVFIWVLFAIRNEIKTEIPEYTTLLNNVEFIGLIHIISMTALTTYLSTEVINDIYSADKGLFL